MPKELENEVEEKEVVSDVAEQEEKNHADEEKAEGADEEILESDEDEGDPEPVTASEEPRTRGENRHQALANERKQLQAEKEQLIAEKAAANAKIELMQQQRYQTDAGEATRKEQEALALMEPHERVSYNTTKELNALKNQMYHMQISSQDAQDKAVFQAKASIDPDYAKFADEIEQIHANQRARGISSSREDLLKWKIGEEIMKNKLENKNKKTATGEKRIRQVSSTPSSARSDTSGTSRTGGMSFEEKFERDYASRGI